MSFSFVISHYLKHPKRFGCTDNLTQYVSGVKNIGYSAHIVISAHKRESGRGKRGVRAFREYVARMLGVLPRDLQTALLMRLWRHAKTGRTLPVPPHLR